MKRAIYTAGLIAIILLGATAMAGAGMGSGQGRGHMEWDHAPGWEHQHDAEAGHMWTDTRLDRGQPGLATYREAQCWGPQNSDDGYRQAPDDRPGHQPRQ